MKKETFKKTTAALLVATAVSSGIFSVKTTEVKASTGAQTALKKLDKARAADKKTKNAFRKAKVLKQDNAINPKVPKAVLDRDDSAFDKAKADKIKADQNLVKAETQYSIAEAKRTAVLRGKKSIRFVTINKKGELVKNSRKAKPGVKYHVNRLFKMGKRSYVEIKLGRKNLLLNAKYVEFK